MKRKFWFVAPITLVVLLLIASIPHLSEVKSVDVTQLSEYAALDAAYTDLRDQYSLYEISTADTIHVVTIKNLWGEWEQYILPCYSSYLPTIPTAGSVESYTGLHILAQWSSENVFTNLFRLKVRDFSLHIQPGENLFVYEKAGVTYANIYPVRYMLYSKYISLDDAVICDQQPTVLVEYSVATNNSAQYRNEAVKTKFIWEYSLRFMGRQIWTGTYTREIDHIVNA